MKQTTSLLVGIVADDLTSATDGAAAFLARGYAPVIKRQVDGAENGAITSIETNSRASDIWQATRAIADAVSALSHARLLFKTIDSTLRGHIRVEVAAAFRASGRSRIVIAPAFPEAGRLTVGGIQTVNGIPVSQSVYGRDPVHPAGTSHIADLVDPSLGIPIILAANSSGDAATKGSILILDADSQNILNRQVADIPDPETVLWVGSPGLAIALASLVPAVPDKRPVTGKAAGQVVIVAGSTNPVTRVQCETLRVRGVPVVSDLADAPGDARVICLRAPLQRQENASAVMTNLAGQAAAAVARRDYDAVIATGGETMAAILDRLGINRFLLTRELEPGFPVGRAERADGEPLTIAMKAGGFGSPSALLDAARDLLANRFHERL
ncbi:MAG: four-carbon acid sugar kinase family protein [Mesorhizobium sp.]|uniref:four-carbon acid sugar kinase family protein n=1 Tax=Mesorhizobium sp. TaxID=1871066 RepID=UPI000FE2BFAB|nr:four-carbon acid sugar kinase family protein [Mesorhizobium sp.]RWO39857.1 MAG: four-carbon acid sugar kinase family protein [Mesorhizobium sp.]TIN74590.1 MAG: four-carbon acid sugar kinase family protein [Mesorhizobium sp.]